MSLHPQQTSTCASRVTIRCLEHSAVTRGETLHLDLDRMSALLLTGSGPILDSSETPSVYLQEEDNKLHNRELLNDIITPAQSGHSNVNSPFWKLSSYFLSLQKGLPIHFFLCPVLKCTAHNTIVCLMSKLFN